MDFKINHLAPVKSRAFYKLDQYTTEYGTLIFDGSIEGEISNCFVYRVERLQTSGIAGFIDFYVYRDTWQFRSIWLVTLSGFTRTIDEKLVFPPNSGEGFFEPVFSPQIWAGIDLERNPFGWVTEHKDVWLTHNGADRVLIAFGDLDNVFYLNESIVMFSDQAGNLTGLGIHEPLEVPKMILKLEKPDFLFSY